MIVSMKTTRVLIFGAFVAAMLTASAFAQTPNTAPSDLPSAPSAAVTPPKQAAPPPQKPAAQAPADSGAPVLKSLEDKKKQPTPQTQEAQKNLPDPKAQSAGSDGKAPLGAKDSNSPDDFTVKKKVEEVNVIFTVTDKHGRFIKDLKKDEFSVMDDKRPAEAIRSFAAETNLPLRVGLLVDASSSIRDRFKFEQESAIEFLNQ